MTADVRRLRAIYAPLLDPNATAHDQVHTEPSPISLSEMRRRLRRVYDDCPQAQRIGLTVGDIDVGITSRERVCRVTGYAGQSDAAEAGAGERATQPGHSTRYRAVLFSCPPPCAKQVALAFYDERRIPRCDQHGEMELVR